MIKRILIGYARPFRSFYSCKDLYEKIKNLNANLFSGNILRRRKIDVSIKMFFDGVLNLSLVNWFLFSQYNTVVLSFLT